MFDGLFDNIGGKIKGLAKFAFIIESIGAIITGGYFACIDSEFVLYGTLTIVLGPVFAYISNWLLYGFGELVENSYIIACNMEGNNRTKEQSSVEAGSSSSDENNVGSLAKKRAWNVLEEKQGSFVGKCGLCGKKREKLVYVEFEDCFGGGKDAICFDCFTKHNCKPVTHGENSKEE